jgi:hypothetical protein
VLTYFKIPLVETPEEKMPIWMWGWEDDTKMDLKDTGYMSADLFQLAHDTV